MEQMKKTYPSEDTVRESGLISEIPVILEQGNSPGKKPVLFLCHGFGSCKEDFLHRAEDISRKGWMVVMMDNRHFGQRPGGGMEFYHDKGKGYNVLRIRQGIKESADDISVIIDYLSARDDADGNLIGMIGISMGGFMSFKALISDQRIKVIAPLISSPWWNDVPSDNLMYVENRRELDDYRELHEPARFPGKFLQRSVFVQLGKQDRHLESGRVVEFCEKLKTTVYSECPERIKVACYDGLGHEVTDDMFDKAVLWVTAHINSL